MSTCCTNNYNRTIIRGDSDRFKVTFTKRVVIKGKETFEPIDITDWTVRFTVRPEVPPTATLTDDDALIKIEAKLIAPKEGIAMVHVPAEITTKIEPGTYFYDIQYIRPADEFGYNQIRSIRKAKYNIIGDITRDNTFKLDGGNSADFMLTDDTDYVVMYEIEVDEETEEERYIPIVTLNPCKEYNGGYAEKEPIERFIDGCDAKAEKHIVKYTEHNKDIFKDDVLDDADDGYEI